VVFIMVDLMAAGAKVGMQVQWGFGAIMEPCPAVFGRLERTAFDALRTGRCIHPRSEDKRPVFRFMGGSLPMGDAAHGMAHITGDTCKGNRAQA
jgi:hypothetical protein